jgi:hypothetical protein
MLIWSISIGIKLRDVCSTFAAVVIAAALLQLVTAAASVLLRSPGKHALRSCALSTLRDQCSIC